ncbi:uncharacterized protein LOC144335255 isoform X3 [Macaca mulatta]
MPWRTLGIAVLAQVESEPYEKNQDSETIKVTEMKLTEPGFRIFFLDSFVGLRTGHPVYSAHCAQPLAGVCRCWQ